VQTSSDRILTTHAGSLPRPEELTALHVRRAAGEAIGEAEFDTAVEEATRDVIAAQLEAGLDIVNNGEAGRESFFTYVQHRMTGFGEASNRPIMADLTRYPGYLKQLAERSAGTESINLLTAPKAVGEVRYAGSPAIEAECAQLQRLLEPHRGRFGEAFVSSPSPGIVAAAMENAYYDDLESYVAALAAALRTEYQVIVQAGFVLQIDAPDLAMERHTLFQDKPLSDFLDFVRVVVAAINDALGGLARERVRLHVCWGNYEAAHDLDVPLADIWPEISRVRSTRDRSRATHCSYRASSTRPPTTSSTRRRSRTASSSPHGPSGTRARSSPAPTAASRRRPASSRSLRTSRGPSCGPSRRGRRSRRSDCSADGGERQRHPARWRACPRRSGSRLGGTSGQFFLRRLGKDTPILTRDVVQALREQGVVEQKSPTSKQALRSIQEAFNTWRDESGRSLCEISRSLSCSVGD
jgi:5-methyltetrahydropteroyltriglutamate--homocysteine methyltransferase